MFHLNAQQIRHLKTGRLKDRMQNRQNSFAIKNLNGLKCLVGGGGGTIKIRSSRARFVSAKKKIRFIGFSTIFELNC